MFNIHPSAWIFLFLWLKVFRYLEKKWKIACEQRSNSIGVLTESQLDRAIVWASKTTGFSTFERELSQEIQRISVLSKLRQWNSCCSHAIFYFFSKYSMTFNSYNLKLRPPSAFSFHDKWFKFQLCNKASRLVLGLWVADAYNDINGFSSFCFDRMFHRSKWNTIHIVHWDIIETTDREVIWYFVF